MGLFRNFRRRGDESNTVVGIILLIMLGVFVGPSVLPDILSDTFPAVDEGMPCGALPTGQNRAFQQSLIGRNAIDPLTITVDSTPLAPTTEGDLTIRITVINETIATVAFIFDPNQVIIGDDGSTGVGLLFNVPLNFNIPGNSRNTAGVPNFDEEIIRLLGPRQLCVHRVQIPNSNFANLQLNQPLQVRAYYRVTTRGPISQTAGLNALGTPQPTPIFPDQGLAPITGGYLESEPYTIPFAATAG